MQILLVDDHQWLCRALARDLEQEATRLTSGPVAVRPIFTLTDAINAINADQRPDYVFLDLGLEDDNRGATTLRRFQQSNPFAVPVAIFTALEPAEGNNVEVLRLCLGELRARGVILKGTDIDRTFVGLGRLLSGEQWMPEEVFTALVTTAPRPQPSKYHLGLSPREWDVARCLKRGLQDKQIASELKLSPLYVRQVVGQILNKLNVGTRTQAALAMGDAPAD